MKKHLFTIVLTGLSLILCSILLAGCDFGGQNNKLLARVNEDNIQYSYDGLSWENLMSIDDLEDALDKTNSTETGAKGDKGDQGEKGDTGENGKTPFIGDNGNWWIGDTDTLVKAQGDTGENGKTPFIGDNGNWWIGDTDTLVKAQGDTGENGKTPFIGDNGNWWIGDTDTLVKAQGDKGEDVTACEHTYGEWQTGIAATCCSMGYNTRVCSKCGDIDYQFTPAVGHTWALSYVAVECTLTQDGKEVFSCSECGLSYVKTTHVHQYDSTWTLDTEPTPDAVGTKSHHCSHCDAKKDETEVPYSLLSYTLNEDEQSYTLIGMGSCTNTDIVVPSTYNNLPVTAIRANAFLDCTTIQSVLLSDNITSIGVGAFQGCTALTEVTLGQSIEKIEENTFKSCTNLTTIKLSDSLKTIGLCAFESCEALPSIVIPDSVETLEGACFCSCSKLQSINLPAGLKTIKENAFSHTGLTSITVDENNPYFSSNGYCLVETSSKTVFFGFYLKKIILPDDGSAETIAESTFYQYDILEEVVISDGIKTIGAEAFRRCENLSKVTMGKDVTTIEYEAFSICENLVSVTLSSSLTKIEYGVFSYCPNLSSIVLPDSVTTIDDDIFAYCNKFTSITIGVNVKTIGNNIFDYCSQLASITYKGTQSQWNAINKGSNWDKDSGNYTIHCTDGDITKS